MVAHRLPARLAGALLLVLAFGCGESPVTQPSDADPAFAKGGGSGVSVTATDPSYGKQGTVELAVRVLGSGFDQGSRASWERNGVADPNVNVSSTMFVNSSELRATIDIAADADIDLYDVAVYTAGGRKGIGTEKFAVTDAEPVGAGTMSARGINDQGHLVGYGSFAFLWSAVDGLDSIGLGHAWDLDQAGTTAVGGYANGGTAGLATIYTRNGSGDWVMGNLPTPGFTGGAARAVASDGPAPTGQAMLIAGLVRQAVSRKSTVDRPVIWTRSGSGWALATLSLAGGSRGEATDVTSSGIIAGYIDFTVGRRAVVWETPNSAPTVLSPAPGLANSTGLAINPSGTIVVGISGSGSPYPALWLRSSPGSAWGPGIIIESGGGWAYDVNDAGLIVGQCCGGDAVAWRLSGTTATRVTLGALGPGQNSWAEAVNASGIAAGGTSGGRSEAVFWTNF